MGPQEISSVKVLARKPGDLGLGPGTHVKVKGKNQLHIVDLYKCIVVYMPTHTAYIYSDNNYKYFKLKHKGYLCPRPGDLERAEVGSAGV